MFPQLFPIFLISFLPTSTTLKLPPFIKVCKRSDPHLNNCIKNVVQNLQPFLAEGIPEFKIPSCEPLLIPEVIIDQGSGPVALKSTYENIKVYGPSRFVLKHVNLDLPKNRIKLKVWLPNLLVTSKYTMEGRILMMPISGTGFSTGNYTNIDATIVMQGQQIHKDNETYWNVKNFDVDFNIGHATIQLDNLFHGDKELGDAMNLFLNDNWRSIAEEIKPVLEDTIAKIFKKLANKICHRYPLSVLLPK